LLTGTWITAAGETVRRQYSKQQGEAACDAISRAIYGRLFSWIVMNVNQMLTYDRSQAPQSRRGEPLSLPTIGILDIFGFENFTVNSFEQLCINLANEQLQFFFNEHGRVLHSFALSLLS
jgi:myosin-3